jgi:hypothetical protein
MIVLPVPIASMGGVSTRTPLQCTRVRVDTAGLHAAAWQALFDDEVGTGRLQPGPVTAWRVRWCSGRGLRRRWRRSAPSRSSRSHRRLLGWRRLSRG